MNDLLDHSQKNNEVERLRFSSRLGCYLLEAVIMLSVVLLALFIANPDFTNPASFSSGLNPYFVKMLGYSYWAVLLIDLFTGLTIGKIILGYRIGDLEGKPADIKKLLIRGGIKCIPHIVSVLVVYINIELDFISSIFSLLFTLGCFWALTSNRQAMHDLVAQTAVYKKKDLIID